MNTRHLVSLPLLLLVGCGTDVSGPSGSLFSCLLGDPAMLEAGDVIQVDGEKNRGLCLAGGGAGADFVYIPFFAEKPPEEGTTTLSLNLTGAGLRAATGPPAPSPASSAARAAVTLGSSRPARALRRDVDFHRSLRRKEARELTPLLRPFVAGASSSIPGAAADVPAVGELRTFNVAISCTEEDLRTGRVEYVSENAVVVADVQNPAGLNSVDYRHFALTFDTLVAPVETAHFGEPTDIDENGRAILFFTRAVNELTAPSDETFTAGFFWSGDLFPETSTARAEACPAANQAEMFYLLSADPLGEAGPAFSVDFIREVAVGIIAHEYQHLINASRRLWVNEAGTFEEPWLNEALSHVAEELMFYAVSGLEPGSNLDFDALSNAPGGTSVFNTYMRGNFSNYARYLEEPGSASLMGDDALTTRGAAWNFLRYAADRSGRADEQFLMEVVNSTVAGLANLQEVLGEDPLAWMQDWTVSIYADDAVPVAARYTQLSWDFRDLYARSTIGTFPLAAISMAADAERSLALPPGATVFARFGLDRGNFGVLDVEAEGEDPPAVLRSSFVRTR